MSDDAERDWRYRLVDLSQPQWRIRRHRRLQLGLSLLIFPLEAKDIIKVGCFRD